MMRKTFITLVLTLMICCLFSGCENSKEEDDDYQSRLFDQSYVHEIDIRISKQDWEDLLSDPASKSKYDIDVIVDGEEYKDVSFSTKGNSSLYFVAAEGNSERYSFKLNFAKNNEDQTYHGLKKFNLGNCFEDPSYMKDFISYEIFKYLGVDVHLTSYVWVKINGKDHGLYLASEDMDKSFIKRNYQGKGVLYKPESEGLELDIDKVEEMKQNGMEITNDSNGADLIYKDDKVETYSDIFENAQTKVEEADKKRLIEALKGLASNKDLDEYLYTEEVIDYFVAQVFLLNYDSYIGPMLHNYYLYENEGKLAMLPWDYNLAFATFKLTIPENNDEGITALINCGIDSPLILTTAKQRPMWRWIMENEEYRKLYHERMNELIEGYITSGEFSEKVDSIYEMIRPYVDKDPNAFYTVEQFDTGCDVLKRFTFTRAESIDRQLSGKLSMINEQQNPDDYVDASDINLFDLR